jgi:hypothetical protein
MYGTLIKKYIEFHKNPFDTTGVFFRRFISGYMNSA